MQILSGSAQRKHQLNPFEQAQENVFTFAVNVQTCAMFEALVNRADMIRSVMALPIMTSSSNELTRSTMIMYKKEMEEIDSALRIYCSIQNIPEA